MVIKVIEMKKIIRKISGVLLTAVIAAAAGCINAFAQGKCEMQVSPKNAGVGEEISVSIEFTSDDMDIQDANANLEYDSTIIEVSENSSVQGADGVVYLKGFAGDAPSVKFDVTFVALKEGTTEISVTNSSAYNTSNESLGSPSAAQVVTVGETADLEADSALKAITVEGAQLSEEFSPDVTSYTVNVENEVTEIYVSAQMNSTKAYIDFDSAFTEVEGVDGTSPKIYGGKMVLAEGKNTGTITVTAENGEETVYTITVTRLESGEIAPIVTTSPDGEVDPDETYDMNIFQSSKGTSAAGSTAKSPSDDNILSKVFPIIILVVFVAAIVLFVIVSVAKIKAEKGSSVRKAAKKTSSSGSSGSSNSSGKNTSSKATRSAQAEPKRVKATVRKKSSGSNNVRKPK